MSQPSAFGPSGRRKRALGAVALGLAAGAIAVGGADVIPAQATTGTPTLQEPKAKVNIGVGTPYVGRFFMSAVARGAKVPKPLTAARLDIGWSVEYGDNSFLFGEFELRTYSSTGAPTTVTISLFPWEYSKSRHLLIAHILPQDTVTEATPEGIPIGTLSLQVPSSVHEWSDQEARDEGEKAIGELKSLKGSIRMNGHGPFAVEFTREKDSEVASPTIPRPKLIGTSKA